MILRALIILVLVAAILGGAGYFANEFFLKPRQLDLQEKKLAELPPPPPPPDPSLAAFEALRPTLENPSSDARAALADFLTQYPESPMAPEARAALGQANVAVLLSPEPSPEKVSYTVVSGDSLVKIASKQKSGAELIYRANQLGTINLKIGQQLVIPSLDTALVVDRAGKTVTLLNAGAFVREYPILSLKLPPAANQGAVETKVTDKVAMKGNVRAAFGTKDFEGSERWVMLGVSGVVLRGAPTPPPAPAETAAAPAASPLADANATPAATPAATPPPSAPPMPPGIVLDPAHAEEIFVLTTRGTPVTIK